MKRQNAAGEKSPFQQHTRNSYQFSADPNSPQPKNLSELLSALPKNKFQNRLDKEGKSVKELSSSQSDETPKNESNTFETETLSQYQDTQTIKESYESVDREDNNTSISTDKKKRTPSKKYSSFKFKNCATKLNNLHQSNFNNLITLQEIGSDLVMGDSPLLNQGTSNSSWVTKFSPDEKFLAIAGVDCILRVFMLKCEVNIDPDNSNELEPEIRLIAPKPLLFSKHTSDIVDLDWSKDSKRIITASIDNKAVLWDINYSTPLQVFDHSDLVACACFHPLVIHKFM